MTNLPINIIITETKSDIIQDAIETRMYVNNKNGATYKIMNNTTIILESLIRVYGIKNLEISQLNEKDSIKYIQSLETVLN